jgi:hypothetical protein
MNADFELILEDCLKRMHAGASIEDCLAAYPAQAEALIPLLLVTSRVRKIARPQARPEAVQAGLERILSVVSTQNIAQGVSAQPVSKGWLSRYSERIITTLKIILFGKENTGMKFALRLAIDVMVILVIGGIFTVNASASSLPGDTLYGVKRTWEDVRLSLTLNSQSKQQLQTNLSAQRRQEVQSMLQMRRSGNVEFEGYIQSISADQWVVDGIQVQMLPGTVVQGTPAVGMYVWIYGQIQSDGSLVASQVRIMNQFQPGYQYPGPGMMSTQWQNYNPQSTPMPGNNNWSTHEPTYMPNDQHHSTQMPQPTYQPTYMPQSTYDMHHDQGPTQDWNHDNNWDQHNDSGGSGMWHH